MSVSTLFGLTGISFLMSATLMRLLLLFKVQKNTAYFISVMFFILSFLPLSGDTLNQYLRGLFNDLSITTIMLLGFYFFKPETSTTENRAVFTVIVITGSFFYPTALGLGLFDPYAIGYLNIAHGLLSPLLLLSMLTLLILFAFINHYHRLLACLVVSTLAYQAGLLESTNLWDYLFDPLIYFYALFALIFQWSFTFFKQKN